MEFKFCHGNVNSLHFSQENCEPKTRQMKDHVNLIAVLRFEEHYL